MTKKNKKEVKELNVKCEENFITQEIELNNYDVTKSEISISDLFSYKKCIDILTNHYNNLLTIRDKGSDEYKDALDRMNGLKRKESRLMEVIEDRIKKLDL